MTGPASRARSYLPFVDWMKALGIIVIVTGHVAGAPINFLTPPIYPKQLGVAFFLFVMGYSLAGERRPNWLVLFRRLFEIYLFGWAVAILVSAIMLAGRGTPNLSNYLPLLLGVNVVLNHFPANPTTWYIGTYLHVLLGWAVLLRGLRIRPWMIVVSLVVEIILRALILVAAGEYIAYMLASNWITVFLLGTWFGQRGAARLAEASDGPGPRQGQGLALWAAALAAFAIAWSVAVRPFVIDHSFPFMRLSAIGPLADALITSIGVSVVYGVYTVFVYQVARYLAAPRWVRFFARNTLIVFIAHMPIFYALDGVLTRAGLSYNERSPIQLMVCLVGLAVVSEAVRTLTRPAVMRSWLEARLLTRLT